METLSILSCLVERPNAQTDSRWWPDLYLRKGKRLLQITPEQASALQGQLREAGLMRGEGSSKVRNIQLHNIDGRRIGHVSYNGHVWLNDIDGEKEVPCAS